MVVKWLDRVASIRHPEVVDNAAPRAIDLVNTFRLDRGEVGDVLADDLRDWLGPVPDAVVERFRRLRDALRRLAAETVSDDRPAATSPVDLADAVAVVNRACASAPAWSE